MKNLLLFLVTLLSLTSIAHSNVGDNFSNVSTLIKIGENLRSNDKDDYTGKYLLNLELNDKCSLFIESYSFFNLTKGQTLQGTSWVKDRFTFKDADSVGSSITSQVDFTSSDNKINITVACFDQGVVFRDVPSLQQLLALLKSKTGMTITTRN